MMKGLEHLIIPAFDLTESSTIVDAIKCLENNHWMIISVVNEAGELCGVASSGDLRKAILNGQPADTALSEVMNKQPVFIKKKEISNHKNLGKILDSIRKKYGQLELMYAMVPVVDDELKLIGMINLDSLTYFKADDSKPSRKTALIVGGAGYIGSVLTRMLIENGWAVRVLDNLLYYPHSLKSLENDEHFKFIHGDAANIDDIVCASEGIDAVVYLAELVGDPACSMAPQAALKTNYLSVNSMAHLCSHLNINRFVYTSSCSVYGASKDPDELLTEQSPLNPVSLYARIKTMVEQSILSVCHLPNPLFAPTILRLGTVFGHSYRPRFDLVVNVFAKNSIQKGSIDIFGGNQWRPNVHVSDVANAIQVVLNAPIEKVRAQVFNVGSSEMNHTISDLADIAQKVFPGIKLIKRTESVDERNYRVKFDKIESTLGYRAKVSVEDGMLELKKAFENKEFDEVEDNPHYSNLLKMQELQLD
ncbi:MAG: NAD-dependent epimerase/dehydratase family protein [Methylococcales bacterium]|nr:NAD-dependent epimerase/dehydratase family protein [Methylococcales bacterium]MBT7408333.1 NAD-dependent epimerase/dehydratase family protein [Methylococcales bacterium]